MEQQTKQLYCDDCQQVQTMRAMDMTEFPTLFCMDCGNERDLPDEYECTNCGYFDEDEDNIVLCTSFGEVSWEYNCLEWDETRKCPICKTIYTFSNANC